MCLGLWIGKFYGTVLVCIVLNMRHHATIMLQIETIDKKQGEQIMSIGFNWNHYEKDKNKSYLLNTLCVSIKSFMRFVSNKQYEVCQYLDW